MRNQITDKFPMYKKIVWGFPSLVASGFWGIMSGYVTYYLTQSVLLSSAAVGMVLMATKIFDGFTDLFAGYFIDKTTTKWGKGRPYSLFASVGWIFIILLFSVPSFFSTTGKLVYVFICSVMIESVSFTLFKCSEHVYMLRAIPNEKDKSSSIAIASVIITYLSTVLAIVMPIAVKSIGSSSRGWTLLALIIGVPAMVLGTFRFVFIKEIVEPAVSASAK